MKTILSKMKVRAETDLVLVRQRSRDIATLLQFDSHDLTRITTAVGEIVREIQNTSGVDEMEFFVETEHYATMFCIKTKCSGPFEIGSRKLSVTPPEATVSGCSAAKRLMDYFEIDPDNGSASVIIGKILPLGKLPSEKQLRRIASEAEKLVARDPIEELNRQNQDLVNVLEELRKQQELLTEQNEHLASVTRELQEANERLQEADNSKSVFLASMSHELRTPLNSILGFTGIILKGMAGPITDEQSKQLGMVRSSAHHLLSLINDILDISKIEAGKVELFPETVLASKIIADVVETVSPQIGEKKLSLVLECPDDLMLLVDARRLKQVLLNLTDNAVKFTNRGVIRIRAKLINETTVKFTVDDSGIGIQQQDLKKLFSPFQQVNMAELTSHHGTGLGLFLCSKLVERMGGSIGVTSEYGVGSSFYFLLPKSGDTR